MIKPSKWLFRAMLLLLFFQFSCNDTSEDTTETDGDWIKQSDYEGDTRSSAVAFVIGRKAYVGTGYNGSRDKYHNDFWAYDLDLNYWTRVADFPGDARSGAVAFTIGDKGYVGTGYNGIDELKDFWEYDPTSNSWAQKADFGGTARRSAVAFSVNGSGYIGTGYDGSDTKDFWQYSPVSDSWVQIPSIGGSKRRDAIAFVIDNVAYVGTGTNNGTYQYDFWALDPSQISDNVFPWTEKTALDDDDYDYTGVAREGAAAFTLNGYGYVATGYTGGIVSTVWEYDPLYDTWNERTSFEGSSRRDAVAFTIDGRGFLTLGRNSSTYFDDIWEFRPDLVYDEN